MIAIYMLIFFLICHLTTALQSSEHDEAWQSLLCYCLIIMIITLFSMEKIWNKRKSVTEKLPGLSSDININ